MSDKFADYLNTTDAKEADCALDYYDGDQEEQLISVLDDPMSGRRDWRQQGMIPRFRNITKMIVEKSGLLFDNGAPKLELEVPETDIVDVPNTKKLTNILDQVQWTEFYNNVDAVVRLLKTALVLAQWDPESNSLVLDCLHRANCEVILKTNNRDIATLIYRTSEFESEDEFNPGKCQTLRVFTETLVQDIYVDPKGNETITLSIPNPYGIIPVAVWYDTNVPRCEFWCEANLDIVNLNEMYNLHLTDSEFAASWAKRATLFTNAKIHQEDGGAPVVTQHYGQQLPRFTNSKPGIIGGPGKVIQLDTMGVDNVLLEYKAPNIDLKPIDDMFKAWISDFAADWSVNIKTGNGTAESGFALVVEEIDNLQLRKKRQRQCEAHFKRFYQVLRVVLLVGAGIALPEDHELEVEFEDPQLPVNQKEQEDVWTIRIQQGRATRVDYFMAVLGMTREEAEEKKAEIDAERQSAIASAADAATRSINVKASTKGITEITQGD